MLNHPLFCVLCLGLQIFCVLPLWAAEDDCSGSDPVLCGAYLEINRSLQALARPAELSRQKPEAAASQVVDLKSIKNKSWICLALDTGKRRLYVGSAMKMPGSGGKNPKMFIAFSSDGMQEPLLIDLDAVMKDKKFNRKVDFDFAGQKLSLEAKMPDNQFSLWWQGGKPAILDRSSFTLTASSGSAEPMRDLELPVPSFFGKVYDSGHHFNLGGEEVALFYGDQAEEGEPAPFGRFAVGKRFLLFAHKTSFVEYHWKNAIYFGPECAVSGAVCSGEMLDGRIKFKTVMLSDEILRVQETKGGED